MPTISVTEIIRIVAGIIVGVVLIVVLVFAVKGCKAPAEQKAAQASADVASSKGFQKATGDAISVVTSQESSDAATDQQTKVNHDAIKAAPGSTVALDPRANDAGLRALCVRRAYQRDPRCVALLHPDPANVAPAHSGS